MTCNASISMLEMNNSIRDERVEFHAEWLRDEPCDATTTGQTTVPVSTLAWRQDT